jgi:hypothetical protein
MTAIDPSMAMNPSKSPSPPITADTIDFEPVSLDSARAALDELPEGVAVLLDHVPGYWEKVRRAPLATDRALHGRAMAWVSELPDSVRPRVTCERYPRVVNAIADAWHDLEGRDKVFEHLLNDRRRGRRGFPIDVEREISALCLYASSLPR